MKREKYLYVIGLILAGLFFAGCVKSQAPLKPIQEISPEYKMGQLTPVLVSVLDTPIPGKQTDGSFHLAYELVVTNAAKSDTTIESIEIRDPERNDKSIAILSTDGLKANMYFTGSAEPTTTLKAAQTCIVKINLIFESLRDIPQYLEHMVIITTDKQSRYFPGKLVERVARTMVIADPTAVISSPVKGERWVTVAACCDSYHRNAILPINGRWHVAQRYAIDWIKLDEHNKMVTGDPKKNESYPQYGEEIFAVADGTIVHVQNSLPDGVPGGFPTDLTLEHADGNSIVQDIGNGRFVLYAHMIPNTIRVNEGDHVRRGQVLGLLGNSGNSDGPHLHFHIMDNPMPLASSGIPYVIDSFILKGCVKSADNLATELKTPHTPLKIMKVDGTGKRHDEMPANLTVIDFLDENAN